MVIDFLLSFNPKDISFNPHVFDVDSKVGLTADPVQKTHSLVGLVDHYSRGNIAELFNALQTPFILIVVTLNF